MNNNELRLLCLDGGGVRGLSSLLILKQLLEDIAPDPWNPPRPCQYFHMIGGTSTGGLIAIMLGRLEMTVDECIEAYTSLSKKVFQKQHHRVTVSGTVRARFDTEALTTAIKQYITRPNNNSDTNLSSDTILYNSNGQACKVFVCACSAQTRDTAVFTSYLSRDGASSLLRTTKIWQAARATSAASTFFDPIAIGPHGEEFVDGAFGNNNPVKVMWEEALRVFGNDNLADRVQCVISIGTGEHGVKPVGTKVWEIANTLQDLATESSKTARDFEREHDRDLVRSSKYFRFNVVQGLQDLGLEDYERERDIVAVTRRYLHEEARLQVRALVEHMQNPNSTQSVRTGVDTVSMSSTPLHSSASMISIGSVSSSIPQNSIESRSSVKPLSQPRENFLFHILSNSPDQINNNEEYSWRKLTLGSYELYDQIHSMMEKDSNNRISMSAFKEQIPPSPLRAVVHVYWPLLDRALPHYPMPKGYAMALLFMLHLRSAINYQFSTISPGRLFILRRFAVWVKCSCGCGREWNFANDLGISRLRMRSTTSSCPALKHNEAGRTRKGLFTGEGEKRDIENRQKWKLQKGS